VTVTVVVVSVVVAVTVVSVVVAVTVVSVVVAVTVVCVVVTVTVVVLVVLVVTVVLVSPSQVRSIASDESAALAALSAWPSADVMNSTGMVMSSQSLHDMTPTSLPSTVLKITR